MKWTRHTAQQAIHRLREYGARHTARGAEDDRRALRTITHRFAARRVKNFERETDCGNAQMDRAMTRWMQKNLDA